MSDEVEGKTAAEAGQDSDEAARKIIKRWSYGGEEYEKLSIGAGVGQHGSGTFVDVDGYYNFYGVMTPEVRVFFKNSNGWTEINDGEKRQNNYFVSATIEDTGFRKLNLVLFDRSFTHLQELIFKAIKTNNTQSKKNGVSSDKDKDKINIIGTEEHIRLGYQQQNLNNNLKIVWGYSEANPDHPKTLELTGPNYFPSGHDYKEGSWTHGSKTKSGETINFNTEYYYNLVDGKYVRATPEDKTASYKSHSSHRWNERNGKWLAQGDRGETIILDQWNQSTLISRAEDFYITNVSSTLTNTGIQYNITAVGTDAIILNAFKFLQKYANLKGTATELMAFFMKSFNEDYPNWGLRVVWADTKDIINGEEYVRNYDGSWIKNNAENIQKMKEDDTTKLEKLLEIQKAYKNIMAVIRKDNTNTIEGDYFKSNSIYYEKFWESFGNSGYTSNIWVELGDSGLFSDLACFIDQNNHKGKEQKQFRNDEVSKILRRNDFFNIRRLEKSTLQYWARLGKTAGIYGSDKGFDSKKFAEANQIQTLLLAIIQNDFFDLGGSVGNINALANLISGTADNLSELKTNIQRAADTLNSEIGEGEEPYYYEVDYLEGKLDKAFEIVKLFGKIDEIKECADVANSSNNDANKYRFTKVTGIPTSTEIETEYNIDLRYLLNNYVHYQLETEDGKEGTTYNGCKTYLSKINFFLNGGTTGKNTEWNTLIADLKKWIEEIKNINPDKASSAPSLPLFYLNKIADLCDQISTKNINYGDFCSYNEGKNEITKSGGQYPANIIKEKLINNIRATLSNDYNYFKRACRIRSTLITKIGELQANVTSVADSAEKTTTDLMGSNYELGRINNILNDPNFGGVTLPNSSSKIIKWNEKVIGKKGKYIISDFFTKVYDFVSSSKSGDYYLNEVAEIEKEYNKTMINLDKDIAILQTELNELSQDNRKLITLSLGGEEAKNNYDNDADGIPSTSYKSIASLFTSYTSQCPPYKKFKESEKKKVKGEMTQTYEDLEDQGEYEVIDETGSQVSVKNETVESIKNMKWSILKEGNPVVVGFSYPEKFKPNYIRRYCWGNGNASQHCVKNLSVQNTSEFGMLNMATIGGGAGTSIITKNNVDETKESSTIKTSEFFPQFANVVALNNSELNSLAEKMVNGIKRGTLEVLGDPSLRFKDNFAPYSYPIFLDIKLQNESGWSGDNNYTQSQLSGYYVVSKFTHNISASGYTTTLEIMSYPGINDG